MERTEDFWGAGRVKERIITVATPSQDFGVCQLDVSEVVERSGAQA